MLCFEIWINGEKTCLAGHEKMEDIQFSIFHGKGMANPHLSVSAKVKTSDTLIQDARWESHFLKVGDEACIRLVDSDHPEPASEFVSFGSKLHPTGEVELFCSFCGRSQNDVKKLIRGAAGNACDECTKTMHDEFEAKL